jgi:hypothetical protein
MAYDALEESLKLLADGPPLSPGQLTRRRRFVPMAVDRDDDVAVTLFARRGVSGQPLDESWVLELRDGEWKILGGGSGTAPDDLLAARPPAAQLGEIVQEHGVGSSLRNADRIVPWGAKHVSYAHLRVAAEVGHVLAAGRSIQVASHGHMVVVWSSRRPPLVAVFNCGGEQLLEFVPKGLSEGPRSLRRHAKAGWFRRRRSEAVLTKRSRSRRTLK